MENRSVRSRVLRHPGHWVLRWLAVVALIAPGAVLAQSVDPPQVSVLTQQLANLHRQGKYDQALPVAQQLLALREAQLGPDHPLTGVSANNLAELHRELGQYDQAVPLFERAVGIAEKVEGPDSPAVAAWSSNLAGLYRNRGLNDKALPLYQKALAIAERTNGAPPLPLDTALGNLASLYRAMARYEQALPLVQRALQLTEAAQGAEHPLMGAAVGELGGIYADMGRYQDALPLYQRALAIAESSRGPEHPTTGLRADNLAGLLSTMGRYEQALLLYQRALAIAERVRGPEHPSTATALNNLAATYKEVGRFEEALPLYQRALAITEKALGANHTNMGTRLGNLAGLYKAMGLYQQALPLYQRALAIGMKSDGPDHPSTATRMSNLAGLYMTMGHFDKALPLYRRALRVSETVEGAEHPSTATKLNNLAQLYRDMGSSAQSVPLFQRAIAISEKTLGPDHPLTSARLNNLANVYLLRGRYEEALPLIQRALAIREKDADPGGVMEPLDSLANYYGQTGRLEEALPISLRTLAVAEKALGRDHPLTGLRLNNLGVLYRDMGHFEPATQAYHRALLIAQAAGDRQLSRLVYDNLMRLHGREGDAAYQPGLAIWYGKQAINTLQAVRSRMQSMRPELRGNFLLAHRSSYQTLANLLIGEGRIAEAEQVLALLKEDELFELTRSAGMPQNRRQADYVGREREAVAEARRLAALAVKDSTELAALERRAGAGQALTEAEETRRQALLKGAKASRAEYQQFIAQLGQSFAGPARRAVMNEADSQVTRLRSQVAQDGEGAVGLHYSVAEDRVGIIVSTARGSFGRFSNVGRKALVDQVTALRKVTLAKADTLGPAKSLWKMLIEPVQADIQAAGAKTLVVSFSDELRYLPLAALQNPAGRYLVEDYALALWASAADTRAAPSAAPWSVSALGLTQARAGFPALPGVLQELNGIVRTPGAETVRGGRSGVLPGSILLDAQFNRRAFESALSGSNNVVHVASHFDFRMGSEEGSVLLLGAGEPLSLGQLAVMDFGRVEQLTLSACDTAMGGGLNENGAEVEGLAAVVLRQRAQSVLATLWKVADDSTARLMHDFYAARGVQNPLSRAQALRQAQLQMLRGAEPGTNWRHPYYWAPFVLSGNWL